MASISAANAVFMLAITGLYPVPQQLQGFDVDDIFDVENIDIGEVKMGVDGKLSSGFVFVPTKQSVSLQADSDSNTLFEAWYAAEQVAHDKFFAQGIVSLPSVGRSYVLANGVLSNYSPMSSAKKVLQPRKFTLTWESVIGAPI